MTQAYQLHNSEIMDAFLSILNFKLDAVAKNRCRCGQPGNKVLINFGHTCAFFSCAFYDNVSKGNARNSDTQ